MSDVDQMVLAVATSNRMTDLGLLDGRPCWLETDPVTGAVKLRGSPSPPRVADRFSCGSSLYGYGGGSWHASGRRYAYAAQDGALVLGECGSGRTVRFPVPPRMTLGDLSVGCGGDTVAVCEEQVPGRRGRYSIVGASRAAYDLRTLVVGEDMVASPRVDAGSEWLAFLTWHPGITPWLATSLGLHSLRGDVPDRVITARELGGDSVRELTWLRDGSLCVVVEGETNRLLLLDPRQPCEPRERWRTHAELSAIPWEAGLRTVAELDSGDLAVLTVEQGCGGLWLVDSAGRATGVDLPFTSYFRPRLTACGNQLYVVAGSAGSFESLVEISPGTGEWQVLESTFSATPDADPVDVCSVWHATPGDIAVQTVVASPPEVRGVVFDCHSGPTDQAHLVLSPFVWLLAQRGLVVAQVNHRGSTGFGNGFRDALAGTWGRDDVDDVVAVLDGLRAELGESVPVFLRGESGGGLTVLVAAGLRDVAGIVSVHGVTDPHRLPDVTHDFEAGYVRWLLGDQDTGGESADRLIDQVTSPTLIIAGVDDPVVPVEQARHLADRLRRNGVPTRLEVFEGQGHGLTGAASIGRELEAEISFYEGILAQRGSTA